MTLEEQVEAYVVGCEALGSPFYAVLLHALAPVIRGDGPVRDVLEPYHGRDWRDAVPLRFLGVCTGWCWRATSRRSRRTSRRPMATATPSRRLRSCRLWWSDITRSAST
jgi:hypothetical protein